MANKYLIFGATYNGDGTSSSEAASNGAAGAWNQASILTGTAPTYGALAAGDVVYIRSKTGAGADADISQSYAASITLGAGGSVATLASPITWILDNGTVWSGKNGTLTYTSSGQSYVVTLRPYNRFIAKTRNAWVIENTHTGTSARHVFAGADTVGMKVSWPNRTGVGVDGYGGITFDGGVHDFLTISAKQLANSYNVSLLINPGTPSYGNVTTFNDLKIESTDTGTVTLFANTGYHYRFRIRGGKITGAGVASGVSLFRCAGNANNVFTLEAIGFQIPKTVALTTTAAASRAVNTEMTAYGLDNGPGAEIQSWWGNADTRNYSNNYPYLNATLPDSASSPVTWRLVPENATWQQPAILTISKLYTSAAASKTVTLEMLVSDNWGAGVINRNSVWMEVSYIDNATSASVTETTKLDIPGTALDSSSASWSGTSWGSVNFGTSGKRKLALTTAGSITQDTAVTVTFFCAAKCANATYDIFMIDPDVQLS